MSNLREKCNEKQRATLDKVRELFKDFYKDNDNVLTYSLTGLILNLTDHHYCDPIYIREKISIISHEIAE